MFDNNCIPTNLINTIMHNEVENRYDNFILFSE